MEVDFLLVGCVLLFLFLKALVEVDVLLIGCVLVFFFEGAGGGGFLVSWLCFVVFVS